MPLRVVAHQHAEGGVEHPCHLVSDGVEHTVRSRSLGDERGHPSQRRLFVGELRELLVCLAVCDRGREELGELGQSLLGVARAAGCSLFETTANTPQRRPSTVIGAPTDERQPISRAASGASPGPSA